MIRKILIIDDSILARMAVRKCLSDDPSYEIHEAADGVTGIAKFKEISPDIIFCDLTMPNMSGFDAVAEMKRLSPDAIIIVLTADAQKKTMEKVIEAGAFMVLNKPPRKDELIFSVQKAAKARSART